MSVRQAAILVGGLGTRLGALTQATPKPLLPVAGRPFLDWLLDEVARHGAREILLVAAHMGERFRHAYDGRSVRGAQVRVLVEAAPSGTGGALRFALPWLDRRFLLLNGDTFHTVNLLALAEAARQPFHLALKRGAPGARYGRVLVEDGRATAFLPPGPGAEPINAGVYVVERALVEAFPEGRLSLEADILPRLAGQGRLGASIGDGFFLDIGVPEDLARAETAIPDETRRPALFLDRDGVLNEDVGHAHRPEQIRWLPGAIATVRHFNDAGWLVFVVTNQAGVARGLYEEADVRALHQWMAGELARAGAHVDAFAYCPFHPEAPRREYRRADRRRKPGPGMIQDLMAEWPVRQEGSFLVGDKPSDVEAAAAAGISGLLHPGGDLLALCRARAAGR